MSRSDLLKTLDKQRRNNNPCILCEKPTRDWDYVCWHCREDWYQGKEARLAAENRRTSERKERIPIFAYWSYLFFDNEADTEDRTKIGYRIRQAAINLADGREDKISSYFGSTAGEHVGIPNRRHRGSSGERSSSYIFPRRGTWKNLLDLNNAILDLAHYYYRDGYKNGRRLLHAIARGELTVKEINERMEKKR